MDTAPTFPEVLQDFRKFLEEHGLLDESGHRLARFCFCSDGPYDIRDFVVKQCFISKVSSVELRLRTLADCGVLRRPTTDPSPHLAQLGRHGRTQSSGGVPQHHHRGRSGTATGESAVAALPPSNKLLLTATTQVGAFPLPKRMTFSIPRQLHALGLEPFEGRQHSGIDVSSVRTLAMPRLSL